MELHARDALSPVLAPIGVGCVGTLEETSAPRCTRQVAWLRFSKERFPQKKGQQAERRGELALAARPERPGTRRPPSFAPVPPPFLRGARSSARAEGAVVPSGPTVFLPLSSLSFINLVATDAA